MTEGTPVPQINASKMPVGSGIAGAIFTISSMAIFLIGIPALQYFLPAAILLGIGVALMISGWRRVHPSKTPGEAWILADAGKTLPGAGK